MVCLEDRQILNKWLLELCAHEAWTDFRLHRCVQPNDFVHGILQRDSPQKPSSAECFWRHLIVFLCTLSDGEESCSKLESKCFTEDSAAGQEETAVTPLENAAVLLDILQDEVGNEVEAVDLTLQLYRQAVFVCCRKGDFQLAGDVFDRVFESEIDVDKSTLKKWKLQIQNVLHSKDTAHPALVKNSFSAFQDAVAEYLRPACGNMSNPFLLKMAAKVAGESKKQKAAENDIVVKGPWLEALLYHWGMDGQEELNKPQAQFEQKLQQLLANKEEYVNNMPEELLKLAEDDSEGPAGEDTIRLLSAAEEMILSAKLENDNCSTLCTSIRKRRHSTHLREVVRKRQHKPVSSKPSNPSTKKHSSEVDSDINSDELLTHESQQIATFKPTESFHKLTTTSSRPLRLKWTWEQEEDLYRSVQKYGSGNWAEIIKKCSLAFSQRRNVDLKDKWRHMVKSGRVQELRDLLGEV